MSRVNKIKRRVRRARGIRANIVGSTERPRLSIHRTLNHFYAQIIDDEKMHTLVAASSLDKDLGEVTGKKKSDVCKMVGQLLAKRAVEKNIGTVTFDRKGFLYHGRVASFATGAREGGLKF